ncbi:MAG: hypothetical protein AAF492_28665, partial [Verrucomicrobiota bacterium]
IAAPLMPMFVTSTMFFVLLTLSIALGSVDAPAVRDGFLKTRPVHMANVWTAKLIWLLVLVILPALIHGVFFSTIMGLGGSHAVGLITDRLVLMLPVLVAITCMAGLASSVGRLFLYLTLTGFALYALGLGYIVVRSALTGLGPQELYSAVPGLNETRLVITLYLVAAGAVVLLRQQILGRASFRGRAIVTGVTVVAIPLIWELWTLNVFTPRQLSASTGDYGKPTFKIDPGNVEMWGQSSDPEDRRLTHFRARIEAENLKPGFLFQPVIWTAELAKNGQMVSRYKARPVERYRRRTIHSEGRVRRQELQAVMSLLGPDAVLASADHHYPINQGQMYWPYQEIKPFFNEDLELSANADIHLRSFEQVATLNLKPGAEFESEGARFKLLLARERE